MVKDELKEHIKSSFYNALCLDTVLNPSYKSIHDTALCVGNTLAAILMLGYYDLHQKVDLGISNPKGSDLLEYMLNKYKVPDVIFLPTYLELLGKIVQSDCISKNDYEFVRSVMLFCGRLLDVDYIDTEELSDKDIEEAVSKPFLIVGYLNKKDCELCPYSACTFSD